MRRWIIVILIIAIISVGTGFVIEKFVYPEILRKYNQITKIEDNIKDNYIVSRIIDGDTIEVMYQNQDVTVRLLGIDAPELNDKRNLIACFAEKSKDELNNKILNQRVELESDTSQGDKDRYGRLLRYVYLNGELVNGWLVKEGYAYAYRQYPVNKLKEFENYETEARMNNRGLWGNECN